MGRGDHPGSRRERWQACPELHRGTPSSWLWSKAGPIASASGPTTARSRHLAHRSRSPSDMTGWYQYGPAPGQRGPAVILGHVDSATAISVSYHLKDLRRGDRICITQVDGKVAAFAVDGVQKAAKDAFPTAAVYAGGGYPAPPSSRCSCAPGPARRSAPASTPRTSRSPAVPAPSACPARATRRGRLRCPRSHATASTPGWTSAAVTRARYGPGHAPPLTISGIVQVALKYLSPTVFRRLSAPPS